MRISNAPKTRHYTSDDFAFRRKSLLSVMLLAMVILVGRAVYLQIFNKEVLQDKGDRRHDKVVAVSAYRGQIQDRNAEPLAISTPVQSIWVNPRQLKTDEDSKIGEMAKILGLPEKELRSVLKKEAGKRFFYLKSDAEAALIE